MADCDRSTYMRKYYKRRKATLLPRAKARYAGDQHEELKKQYREKYTPATQRHSIYRQ